MRDILAKKLLAKVTDWDPTELTEERLDLQLLSEYKYDEYQQFFPGMRFIESLSLWLNQFDTNQKNLAYNLIKKHLIFISTAELHHLIRMAYPDFVKPFLINHSASELGIPDFLIKRIATNQEFKILLRKCLFLGLSDGAKTDLFRRFSGLDHEQVYPTYLITEEKSKELLEELNEKVTINKYGLEKFKIVFLIDDFSASGISYIREESPGEFHGKIQKFLKQLEKKEGKSNHVRNLFDMETLKVCVILYIATKKAKEKIEKELNSFAKSEKIDFKVIVIQEIDDSIALTNEKLGELAHILEEKFDPKILTKHYKKGKIDNPYLGFDECGLPLVLSHNCPNNSLPIIWHETEDKKYRALFPRLQRFRVLS